MLGPDAQHDGLGLALAHALLEPAGRLPGGVLERGRHEDEVLAARCENVLAVVSNVDADDRVCGEGREREAQSTSCLDIIFMEERKRI